MVGQTALLVIDVQNIYAAPESPLHVASIQQSIPRINALAAAFAMADRVSCCAVIAGCPMAAVIRPYHCIHWCIFVVSPCRQ